MIEFVLGALTLLVAQRVVRYWRERVLPELRRSELAAGDEAQAVRDLGYEDRRGTVELKR